MTGLYGNEHIKTNIDGTIVTFKSRFEYRYAQYLEFCKKTGLISDWDYEGKLGRCDKALFVFKDVETAPVNYLPDFWVDDKGYIEYHETKGFLSGKDITKFKRMWEQYTDVKLTLLFMHKPKLSPIRRGKVERYCNRIIWNARTVIFSRNVRAIINW